MAPLRIAPLVLASLVVAAGCGDPGGPAGDGESETGASTTDAATDGGFTPVSTVTGVTSGGGDEPTGSSEGGSTEDTTGAAIDEAPTIELLLAGSAEPAVITEVGTQTITAKVADDRGLDRVEIFLDDAPLAEIELAGALSEVVEVGLPFYESAQGNEYTLHAVVHDDARHKVVSPPIDFEVALPPGGSKVWEAVSESKFVSKALAVAVDSMGDVIAVGEQATSADPLRSRMVIRKYDGESGALQWQREVPSQMEAPTPLGDNRARGVAVDAYDNVYVVGEVNPTGVNYSLWLGKFTFDGLLAKTYVSDDEMSRGNGVAVDGDGHVFVVGYRRAGDMNFVATVDAFNPNLTPIWGDTLGDLGLDSRAYGAAIDRHGDVVVVGSTLIGQGKKALGLAALYTPSGARLWGQALSSPEPEPLERLFSVAVDAANEYICVGKRKTEDDKRRLWLLRLGDHGQEIKSEPDIYARCGDPDFGDDTDVCAVALGPLDRTLIAGVVPDVSDDVVIKRTKSDWAIHLWDKDHDGLDHATDRGLAVAADPDGFVIAAGYETRLGAARWWVSRRNP